MKWFEEAILGLSVFIGALVIIAVVLTLPTYFLWNWLMPPILGLTKITLLQALGINILCGILFRDGKSSKKK